MKNTTYEKFEVNSNVTLHLMDIPNTEKFNIVAKTDLGANIEKDLTDYIGKSMYGTTHILEHISFKSSHNRSTEEIKETLSKKGTYNASTDHDEVVYYFNTLDKNKIVAMDIILDALLNTFENVAEEEFNNEIDTIVNEINMYAEDKLTSFNMNTRSKFLNRDSRDNILGIPEDVKKITIQDIALAKKALLLNSNIDIIITYDSNLTSDMLIKNKVIDKISIFHLNNSVPTDLVLSRNELENSNTGYIELPTDSEKEFLFSYFPLDTISPVIGVLLKYIYETSDTSLYKKCRMDKGLFYRAFFFYDIIGDKPFLVFAVDYDKDKREVLLDTFVDSIKETISNYTKDIHDELLTDALDKASMTKFNLYNIGNFLECHDMIREFYIDNAKHDLYMATEMTIKENFTYEHTLELCEDVLNSLTKDYTIVCNNKDSIKLKS